MFFIWSNWENLSQTQIDLGPALGCVATAILILVLRAASFFLMGRAYEKSFSFLESLGIVSKSTVLNLVFPARIGSFYIIQRVYKRAGGKYMQAAGLYIGASYFQLILSIVCVLIGPYVVPDEHRMPVLIFGVALLMGSGLIAYLAQRASLGLRVPLLPKKVNDQLAMFFEHFGLVFRSKLRFAFITASLLEQLALSLALQLALQSLGASITILESLFFTGIRNLTLMIAITPGALGLSEMLMGFSGQVLSISASVSSVGGLLLRFCMLGVGGIGYVAALWRDAKHEQ